MPKCLYHPNDITRRKPYTKVKLVYFVYTIYPYYIPKYSNILHKMLK